MPSTYTLNNGIELIGTGEQSGSWGDTTNTNLSLIDTALDGQVTVTLGSAGSSGSPNTLPISDGAASNGRNRMIIFDDGGDLGATAYVQLTPNNAEKIIYVRNDLSGSRSILLFQGTYSASNDYEVPAGTTAVVYFDGGGTGAVAANVFNNAHFDALNVVGNTTLGGNLTVNGNTTLGNAATDTVTVTADVASDLIPSADGTYDLGASGSEWKDLYIDGTANIDTLTADAGTIGSVTITSADINGGTVDGATIATSDITVGVGKTLDVSAGTLTLANDQISGDSIEGGTIGSVTIASADINGGTIDGTVIGGTTPAAISGTTGTFSGDLTVDTNTLYVDSADNRVGIGTTTPAHPLDVTGTAAVSGNVKIGDGVDGSTDADNLVVSNDNANVGMSFLCADSTGIVRLFLGSQTDRTAAKIQHNETNERLVVQAKGDIYFQTGGTNTVATLNTSGDLDINGALSKGSGSFKIDHPLMPETHHLVHSFLEGPQADNLYRGTVALVGGTATVNLDEAGRMTEGTFVALNGNVQCFTSNEQGWTAVRGSVSGNILTIEAQDATCTDTVSWMVIGERKDQHMIDTHWTDAEGRVITEPEKIEDTQTEAE